MLKKPARPRRMGLIPAAGGLCGSTAFTARHPAPRSRASEALHAHRAGPRQSPAALLSLSGYCHLAFQASVCSGPGLILSIAR